MVVKSGEQAARHAPKQPTASAEGNMHRLKFKYMRRKLAQVSLIIFGRMNVNMLTCMHLLVTDTTYANYAARLRGWRPVQVTT